MISPAHAKLNADTARLISTDGIKLFCTAINFVLLLYSNIGLAVLPIKCCSLHPKFDQTSQKLKGQRHDPPPPPQVQVLILSFYRY